MGALRLRVGAVCVRRYWQRAGGDEQRQGHRGVATGIFVRTASQMGLCACRKDRSLTRDKR